MKIKKNDKDIDNKKSILFLGDVVPYKSFKFKNNFKTVFNLECPITAIDKPITGKINLKISENYLKNIFDDTILCACISNNHILDYGKEGLESTLLELKKKKIRDVTSSFSTVPSSPPNSIPQAQNPCSFSV